MIYPKNVTYMLRPSNKPVNTSGRSKAQIVDDMENGALAVFLVTDEAGHNTECRCNRCFRAKLDALVATSEEATNDIHGNLVGHINRD